MKLNNLRRPTVIAAVAVGVVALGLGGTAAADGFITGKDVKNNSLSGADIKNGTVSGADIKTNSVTWRDIENGTVRGTEVRNGSLELKDLSDDARDELNEGLEGFAELVGMAFDEAFGNIEDLQAADTATAADIAALELKDTQIDTALENLRLRIKAAEGTIEDLVAGLAAVNADLAALDSRVDALEASAAVDSNWGSVLRNVIGSATSQLRQGPGPLADVPSGKGSLEINVGTSADKAAFGNEVDFAGDALSSIGSPSFSVYQTGENNAISAGNLPNIAIEVDPNLPGRTYSTLNFVPTKAATSNAWTQFASTDGYWYFTGGTGTDTNCGAANSCTLVQALAAVPDATIYSVAISKGRDSQFHGAVDALQIGGTTYDFEARGVIASS